MPITLGVHDNHYCSANPRFIAVVTECSGGGSFVILPIHHVCNSPSPSSLIDTSGTRLNCSVPQTGRVDPQHPRVCGHTARVLDVKWNPFDDHCIASCSEDGTVRTLPSFCSCSE